MARKRNSLSIFIMALMVSSFCLCLSANSSNPKSPSLTSSQNCKQCHEEIHNHWMNAMHAMSLEDPIFKASYMESYFNTAGEAKYNCLPCHAPVTRVNKDYDLKDEITKEGVTCDFCHSIKKVDLDNNENPFELEIGNTKRGPLSNVSSPTHETESSPIFKSSELCAGCHEYTNEKGISILGTYSEWKESPFAKEGTHCQDCHMPIISGNTVKSNIKSSIQEQINLHAISASHSTEQLQKALKVEIKNVNQEGEIIEVVVGVSNVGSGHSVPTGISARQLILLVELRTPNEYFVQQKIYHRILSDEAGNEIKKECEAFLGAAKISFDNRLRPRETRTERFAFAKPKNKKITISARVDYLYRTRILSPTEMRVKMAEDTRTLNKK